MTIKEIIKKDPDGLVARAYKFSQKAHAGQKRRTGEPFFNHPLAAAETLANWGLDEETIAAGLLHDIIEDTSTTETELVEKFGKDVAFIVDGVSKLGHIKYRGPSDKVAAYTKVENLRKMVIALSQDLRVVFVKLADRLHNMKTLAALPPAKQKRIALETDEIYAPLAYRLGMYNLNGELHDLAFPYLAPKRFEWVKNHIPEQYEERRKYLERLKPAVEKALKEHDLEAVQIDFRAKRYNSLYQKLLKYDMDLDKIYDLVAMRIIMKNVGECYAALGIIHELYPPLPGRIKDYIAMPKPNGYRSLHTTVIAAQNKFVEFQIRTEEMHLENEFGIAAHWIYQQERNKRGLTFKSGNLKTEASWIEQLKKWQSEFDHGAHDPEAFLHATKVEFFKDRIFVITPIGEVLDLPVGSTPVDFAYHIHTTLGHTCVGAKVNHRFVPLDHELQSGDVVEILAQKNKQPSENWLSFVKTAAARDKIKSVLNQKKTTLRSRSGPTKTELKLTVQDRFGLLKEVTDVITRSHVNIRNLQTVHQAGNQFPIIKIQCQVTDKDKIQKLAIKLKKIKGVREINFVTS